MPREHGLSIIKNAPSRAMFTDILINFFTRGRAEPRSARLSAQLCAQLSADIGKLLRTCPYKVGVGLLGPCGLGLGLQGPGWLGLGLNCLGMFGAK